MNQIFFRVLGLQFFIWLAPLPVPGQAPDSPLERPEEKEEAGADATNATRRGKVHRHSLGDLVVLANDAVVKQDETAHDVVVLGGSASVDGTVTGDLVVVFGKARLGPKAEIRRDLVVIGGVLQADPAAKIGQNRVVIGGDDKVLKGLSWLKWPAQWFNSGLMYARPLPHQYLWGWAIAGIALLLYLAIAVLFPRQIQAAVDALEEAPGNSLVTGLLAFLLLGPFFLLLAVTVVGLLVVPFAVCALVLSFLFGKVAVYRYAGQQVGAQLGSAALQQPLLALLIGALLFCLLYTVPILGCLVWGTVAPLGLGAVLLAVCKRSRPKANGTGVAAPVPPEMAVAAAAAAVPAGPGQPPELLPRVGFWMRLLASVLDLLLVGLVFSLLFHRHRLFLFFWVVYHLAFWSWKGTTIGGIILGLKIVRTDGQPMNFAVALVRLLGSFFSAAALGLGFFWAGWSPDKQAWHDKIAGTAVVKLPKSTPLL